MVLRASESLLFTGLQPEIPYLTYLEPVVGKANTCIVEESSWFEATSMTPHPCFINDRAHFLDVLNIDVSWEEIIS